MTRVNFYILKDDSQRSRSLFACRLIQKAYHSGAKIYIHSDSSEDSSHLDDLLWTFNRTAFIPHECINIETKKDDAEAIPVLLGHANSPEHINDILINLSAQVPVFFSRFKRVMEIVNQDQVVKENGREHYRFYKDRGYALESHQIK